MNIFKILGFVIAVCAMAGIIRQHAVAYYVPIVVAACCIIILTVVTNINPLIKYSKMLAAYSAWADINIVIKAVGISVITQFAQDMCRDSGHTSLANNVSLAGKLCILLAAMPLFAEFADIVRELLE